MSVEDLRSRSRRSITAPGRSSRPRTRPRPCPEQKRTIDVLEAKIRPPALRPGVVPRAALVNRLCRDPAAVVSVVAPAGYGKTTLLAQLAAAEPRAVAWLSVDARDNDALVLLKHVVASIDGIEPLDARLVAALSGARNPALTPTIDRAARALTSPRPPFVLVVDNVDLLHSRESRAVLSMLIGHVPDGSTLVLSGRTVPKLPTAALRARGHLRELGIDELALRNREAQLLLRTANTDLSRQDVEHLVDLCEGWPAALYLASLSLRDGARAPRPNAFGGSDRYLADYIRSEYLSDVRARDLRFLRRSSILSELSGALCKAVLGENGCETALERLARAHLVIPLDGKRGWYRLSGLCRDLLLRDLLEEEPQIVPTLHRRAADWYEAGGDPESALDHAQAMGDADRVAAIITAIALPASGCGRVLDLERWLAPFDDTADLERYPAVALHGSRVHALRGRTAEAEQWLAVAERGARRRSREAAALRPRIAVVRATLCRDGARRMLADAGAALARLPHTSQWYPAALHVRGCAAMLLGATEEADALLDAAARAAEVCRCSETRMIALGQRSLIARAHGDLDRADALSNEARQVALSEELEAYPTFAIVLAAAARASLRHGHWAEARELVAAAEPLRPSLTEALPWLAVSTRLELAQCYLILRDAEAAQVVMAEIDALLEARPKLGTLPERAGELRHDVGALSLPRGTVPGGLTGAELRLLPLLATHLSFREIADQLRVSRNTVKTQAISIYRKLGVSGRSEAIAAAAGSELE